MLINYWWIHLVEHWHVKCNENGAFAFFDKNTKWQYDRCIGYFHPIFAENVIVNCNSFCKLNISWIPLFICVTNKSTYRKFGCVSCWHHFSVLESCCKFQFVHFVFVHLLIGFKIYDGISTVQRISVSVVMLALWYKTCTRLKFSYRYMFFKAEVVKFKNTHTQHFVFPFSFAHFLHIKCIL